MSNLEYFIENFYEDKNNSTKLKDILIEKSNKINESKTNYSKIKRVILIGEMKFKSLRLVSPKLDYADPTKLKYIISEDSIEVFDDEYKFKVNKTDSKDTVIFIRSGYKNNYIKFLLDKFIEFGFLVINDPTYVNISNDKFLSATLLDTYNIPQPKYVLIDSNDIHKGDDKELNKKLKTLYDKITDDTKFVCKILNGHGGKGVFLCTKSNITSVLQCFFAINNECKILVQEFLNIKEGDIRVHVITLNNKQTIINSSLRKKSENNFRTNLSLGNSQIKNYELTKEQKELALKTAKSSGLIWCGVDILPLENNKNVVIEYNGAPGPPSELTQDKDSLEKENEEFYTNLLETINNMI